MDTSRSAAARAARWTSTRRNPLKGVLIAGIIVIAVMGGLSLYPWPAEAQCTGNDPTAPCFAQNNDILSGERSLLRDDDLWVNVWHKGGTENVVEFEINTSQMTTATPIKRTFASSCVPDGIALTQSVIGRVFFLANDVVASIRPDNACNNLFLHITDPKNSSNNSTTTLVSLVGELFPRAIAMADFNRDGYQDIFFLDSNGAQVYTARCTNDPFAPCTGTPNSAPSNGLTPGMRFANPHTLYTSQPVTGDFNGDGAIDVAWPIVNGSSIVIMFVSVCPSADLTVLGHTCSQPLQIIQTSTQINTGRTVNSTSHHTPRPYIGLTANNFDGSVNPTTGIATAELLLAAANDNQTKVDLTVYRFDQNLAPQAAATLSDFPNGHTLEADENNTLQLFLASGPLDGSTGLPQAVFGSTIDGGSVDHHGFVSVIAFDEDLNMTTYDTRLNTGPNDNKKTRIFGLAVGRFDPPDDPDTGDTDFDQQVAVLVDFDSNSTHLQLFTIPTDPDVDGFPLTLAVNQQVSSTRYYDNTYVQLAALAVGDLQGRSLVLGAPSKVTVAQTQPDIILGLPPMHVDFITPPGEVAPRILNLSVFPSTFNTGYEFEVSSGTQSSRRHNTSYSISNKEVESGKQVFGDPKASNVTIKTSHAETQAHQNTTSKSYNTYSSRSDSFESETEFDDLVAASSVQMNIYSYPVIGQFTCPADGPDDCPDDQKLPLQVQYSGPDNIVYIQPADAGGFEWYQPITEPGNIFSYSGNLSLLEAGETRQNPDASSLDLLTPDNIVWESQSNQTVRVEWTAGGEQSQSSGTSHTHSYDTSNSVSGKAKYVAGSTEISAEYDYHRSTTNSTLTTSTQTLDASTGVVLHRGVGSGGSADDANFRYSGQTFIFGLPPPEGMIQTDLDVPTNVKTHGPIEVAHAANMLSTGLVQSGDWWKQAYTVAPDVALNHPQRWLQKLPTAQNPQQVMFNCPIGFTSALGAPSSDPGSCTTTTTQPNTVNVNDAAFYRMKGFFILPEGATTGPAMTIATLGDILTLQARVYNYSLKNMDPGTTVHVRFYAQAWDATRGQFASGSGQFGFAPAVFIGEDVLEPIPAFCGGSQGAFDSCSDANAPMNWALAQVQWDTSTLNPLPATDTNWKFWVVAWLQEGAQLVSEIAEHGLTSIPAQNVDSLAEIPVETYSNNLGFYNQVFTLELPTADAVAQAGADEDRRRRAKERSKTPRGADDKQDLAIEAFEVSPVVLRDRLTTVRIHHRANGRAFDYVRAFLYEGDPLAGGKLLDMDIVPRVPQDESHVIPFHYLPRACGAQQLFVQAAPVDGGPIVEATLELAVTLDPQAETRILGEQLSRLSLHAGIKRSLVAKLKAAEQSFQRGNHIPGLNQLAAFAHELRAQSGKKIPAADAERLIAGAEDIADCVQFKKPKRDKKEKKEKKEKKGRERTIPEARAMAR